MKTKIEAKLIALTQPTVETPAGSAEALVAYCARVSNPANQDNPNAEKLLNYCIKNRHWSIFEMANAVVEVEAPRDITRQLLRHRSFSFQEFSQRYSDQIEFTDREFRRQDVKNRQNSIDDLSYHQVKDIWTDVQDIIADTQNHYKILLKGEVAKECARVILPEGLTMSRLYVNGTLRSWMHYLDVREEAGTQLEHRVLAGKIRDVLTPAFPTIFKLKENDEQAQQL